MWLQVGPTYWIKSSHHLVLGRPRSLLFPRGIHSVTLIVHLLSHLLATWPAHLCLLSLMLLIMSVTPLCFLILYLHNSIHREPFFIAVSLDWLERHILQWHRFSMSNTGNDGPRWVSIFPDNSKSISVTKTIVTASCSKETLTVGTTLACLY